MTEKKYLEHPSNFDKFPFLKVEAGEEEYAFGYQAIAERLNQALPREKGVLVVDCYVTTNYQEIIDGLAGLGFDQVLVSDEVFLPEEQLLAKLQPFITEDRVYGHVYPFGMDYLIDPEALHRMQAQVAEASGRVLVIGVGAAKVTRGDVLVYAGMPRWEIQMRYRYGKHSNFRTSNAEEDLIRKYKRGYFVDWRMCDEHKREIIDQVDHYLDTTKPNQPKLLGKALYLRALQETARQPFRVMPYFDEGLWGGHWLEEVCDVHDPKMRNLAWSYTCLLEENSLLVRIADTLVELPSIDLSYYQPLALLGEQTYSRFGNEFPIRFDFLDTMGGGNLSLQVHPSSQYIRESFGMNYTQEESYYIMDAEPGGSVYLGLKTGFDKQGLINDLREAQKGTIRFDDTRYINNFPVKKHDHLHIPNGTIHCSSKDTMVLEISSSPAIFTMKLWDWGRVGLDGIPRPTHVERGLKNIRWDRTTDFYAEECVNDFTPIAQGDGWREERTGLQKSQFIETRRHWFSKPVRHVGNGEFAVFNLVEGREAVVQSPTGQFEDFVVHYAETFIIPASVDEYIIAPHGAGAGQEIATIKAFVRYGSDQY